MLNFNTLLIGCVTILLLLTWESCCLGPIETGIDSDSASYSVGSSTDVDVESGETAILRCRFNPRLASSEGNVFFWSQHSHSGWDNVAIGDVSFRANYRVDFVPSEGKYDLEISGATYDKDNGQFACKIRRGGGKSDVHTKSVALTVLKQPSPPVITHPPLPFIEDSAVDLECSSTGGSPAPDIAWFKIDGATSTNAQQYRERLNDSVHVSVDRTQPTVATLRIMPSRQMNGATLQCVVWNRALSDKPSNQPFTATIQLKVNYFPRVQLLPAELVRVPEGEPVRVECRVDAQPAATAVRWLRHGSFITSTASDSGQLLINRAQISDAGLYTCSAENSVGERRSDVQLDVLHAPRVSVEPRLTDVTAGASVQVTCHVTANPHPDSVYWLRVDDSDDDDDGAGGEVDDRSNYIDGDYSGESGGGVDSGRFRRFRQMGATLRLDAVTASDHGVYMCVAENTVSPGTSATESVSSALRQFRRNATATLHVRHAPGVARVRQLQPTATRGHKLSLKCSAQPPGYPEPTYSWWRQIRGNSQELSSVEDSYSQAEIDGWQLLARNGSNSYVIERVEDGDAGVYACRAGNVLDSGSAGVYRLNVLHSPQFTIRLQPDVVRPTGTSGFYVSCSAEALPAPEVVWLLNGELISTVTSSPLSYSYQITTDRSKTRVDGGYRVDSTLSFRGESREGSVELLRPEDRGNYTCRFSNSAGVAESTMALRIEHKPIDEGTARLAAFNLGEPAELSCRVAAFPAPRFSWTRGNQALDSASGYYSANPSATNEPGVYVSTLRLTALHRKDYGKYQCLAVNEHGRWSTLVQLQPKSGPSTPRQLKPAVVAGSWVQLVWIPGFDGGYRNTEYRVSLLDDRQREMERDCGVRLPCNITELQPQTTYRLRIRAHNNGGYSPFSEQLQVTTAPESWQLPKPHLAVYEPTTGRVAFRTETSPAGVVARVQYRSDDNVWYDSGLSIDLVNNGGVGQLTSDLAKVNLLRVRVCLRQNTSVCGSPDVAKSVTAGSILLASSTSRLPVTKITVVAVATVVGVALLVLLFICCCRRRHGNSKVPAAKHLPIPDSQHKQHTFSSGQTLPPYYPPGVLEKQTVSPVIPSAAVGTDKSAYAAGNAAFDYGQPTNGVGEFRQVAAPVYTSGTENGSGGVDSQNGGSLNSQHSLWHVRANGDLAAPPGVHSAHYTVDINNYDPAQANYFPDAAPTLPVDTANAGYPASCMYDGSQLMYQPATYAQHQPGMQHQPYADAYHVSQTAGSSMYPAAYLNTTATGASGRALQPETPGAHRRHFDESVESGISTPSARSRRVIREVVV